MNEYDSSVDYLNEAKKIILQEVGLYPARVLLFGSRARGAFSKTSDIDVALDASGAVPPPLLERIRDRLENSVIPYRVDVVDLFDADDRLRKNVRSEGVVWKD